MSVKNFMVIVNPRGGTRRAREVLRGVEPAFRAAGAVLEVRETERAGHALEIAETMALDSCAGLVVIGGDGTVHEVVNGLMRRDAAARVPLGVIPAGSGNTVAEHLGCLDPRMAAERIIAGTTRPLDVVRLETGADVEFCVNIIGWGAAVDINRRAEKMRWLGPARYSVAALWEIVLARRRHAKMTLDGRVIEDEFFFAVGCNTKFTGRGMKLAPDAEMNDGLLDVVLVRHATRRQMLAMFSKVFDGSHLGLGCAECHKARSFAIETRVPETLNLDGELKSSTPVKGVVLPAALHIFAA